MHGERVLTEVIQLLFKPFFYVPVFNNKESDFKKLITHKIFVMKKYLHVEMSTSETIALVIIMGWIAASFFVPLPEVNSLGF